MSLSSISERLSNVSFSCPTPQIPFDNFVRTNAGEMSQTQIEMVREKVKSVGISILGGNSGVEGKYELGIDSIRLVNEDETFEALESKYQYTHHAKQSNALSRTDSAPETEKDPEKETVNEKSTI